MHTHLNHFTGQQKLTQYCKSTIFQLNKKKRTTVLYIFMMFWVGQKVHSGFFIILQKNLKKIFWSTQYYFFPLEKLLTLRSMLTYFLFLIVNKYNILPQRGKNEKERDEAPTVLLAPWFRIAHMVLTPYHFPGLSLKVSGIRKEAGKHSL